jgi:D-alanyl-D-alanine carboxypeptidase (penicillin-binding protein 5/6)
MIFQALAEGRLHLDDEFTVSEHAWRTGGAPAGGSAMFLALTVRASADPSGLVIQSGNDRDYARRRLAAIRDPLTRMNGAAELGLVKSSAIPGHGQSGPKVTARKMAEARGT